MDHKSDQIRDEIEALRKDVADKIEALRDRAVDSVGTAREAVNEVSEKLDGSAAVQWIRERPLLAVGGALAAGYALGRVLTSSSAPAEAAVAENEEAPAAAAPSAPKSNEFDVFKDLLVQAAIQSVSIWAATRLRGAAQNTPVTEDRDLKH